TKIDSLEQLIDSRETNDQVKVRLLNDYAQLCFHNHEFLKGLVAAKEAKDISLQLSFEGGKIMYLLTLASYFGDGPMYTYYRKQAQWQLLNADKASAKYYVDVDSHYYDWGTDFAGLVDKFSAILKHFESSGDMEMQAIVLQRIGQFKFMLNNLEENIAILDKTIKLYTDLGQAYPVFFLSTRKMTGLAFLGRTGEARTIETELIELIARNKDDNAIGLITSTMANGFSQQGRYALAIEYFLKSIETFDREGDQEMRAENYQLLGIAYENMELDSKASECYRNYLSILETLKDSSRLYLAYDIMVSPLIALKKYDEARKYMTLALGDTVSENRIYILARYNDAEGQILRDQERYDEAIVFFKKAYGGFVQNTNSSSRWGAPFMPLYIARCHLKLGNYKEALEYAQHSMALENALPLVRTSISSDVSLLMSETYERLGNEKKAFEYLKKYHKIRYESDRLDEVNRIADAEIRSLIDKSQEEIVALENGRIQTEQQNRIQRLWIFSISGALLSALVLALVLYRNNKNKQQANALLSEQKEEIQTTLERLETTQSQLIQSEKMASLGELTAGIAHEIQNPLNFVNNFSEVNKELLAEMDEGIEKGNFTEVKDIVKNIISNEEKIRHHGKRADAIVRAMLQHSRSSVGVKEHTDINALCDEFLRLSYHGFRAKDNTLNTTLNTDYDKTIGTLTIVPQDMGRVILNLINNAFYAVKEKKAQVEDGYIPTISVSTKKSDDHVLILVKDNGNGIPQKVLDKIFQPFFTTKPAGQGTGLGLSLSYDIVKAHGGELKVETWEGEGSEFVILLPLS
ncbi:MAG TPA: ATP-binding protein, partial [Chryseolinea sp.]